MPEEGPDELEELIEFLSDSRPQVRPASSRRCPAAAAFGFASPG